MRWLRQRHLRLVGLGLVLAGAAWVVNSTRMAMADEKDKDGKAKTVALTEQDSGSKVMLAAGDSLAVILEKQAGTAFSWIIAKNDKDQLRLDKSGESKADKPGGKTLQLFVFQAQKTGTSELELQYKRPFDKDKAPAKTFKVTVQIEKSSSE
jgi:inhibitor of cysteine peptidase